MSHRGEKYEADVDNTPEQRAGNWGMWQTSLHNPDFTDYTELCGVLGMQVNKVEYLDTTQERVLNHPGPALVEVMTDAEVL